MNKDMIYKVVIILFFITASPVFGEETLVLPVREGSHSVGNDQNNLGMNAYKKKKFDQALKHFQVASIVDRKKGEIFLTLA